MAKILLVTDNIDTNTIINTTLLNHEILCADDITTILDIMKVEVPDIIILDSASSMDIAPIFRQVKDFQVIKLILMGEKPVSQDILSNAHLFVSKPINSDLLKSTINAGLKTKKSLVKFVKSNQELANSLYQLNVLYNTSTQLAGNLSRDKLIDVLNEGIDKSLNSNVSCTLSFKDDKTPVLIINSNNKLSSRLVEALKLRALLNYKNSNIDVTEMFNIDDIEVEQLVKYNINEYDFEILNYNKLISYITIDNKCYGYSEIFREKDFSADDSKCFYTLINQMALPLKSAILYQEIARLERLKSEFISIASHELKTPLTSIKNSLDIISSGKTGEITEAMKKFIDMAKRNVNKLSKIISGILDISKIESGMMDYIFKPSAITPLIEDVVQNVSQIALNKNLKINIKTQQDLKDVYADMDRIEQVLTNLITNAIKFSPDNGVISISAKMISSDDIFVEDCFSSQLKDLSGDYVQVCVSDQGIGIPKNDLDRVFDKFVQIETTLSRDVGGSGLGLSIAKQIVAAHKGMIWCSSELNKGSSFYFVLPVAK